ncbi:MAG TPA: glycoside hydrolase family 127 protein [Puia sp.]
MRHLITSCLLAISFFAARGQSGLTNTSHSPHATLQSVNLGDIHWTNGFWADEFATVRDSMIPTLWRIYTDPNISHAFANFRIAAGLDTGSHVGPPFHDGDFYKLLEGMAVVYAMTKDRRLDSLMDLAIAVIARAQRPDGYIHTPTIIEERHQGKAAAFEDRLNFETYNMGHLMTAACIHYRATGKRSFLDLAIKAAGYLEKFYQHSSPQLARNAICPSHYMGLVELYRTTGNPDYLRLAQNLIDIRGLVDNGTDDNQDRVPFRQQTTAMGHAVRANYLYAGVADIYMQTGEDSLWYCLNKIWTDVAQHKLYITGGCGALYDGVSPDAISYNPAQIQEVHQAYGRDYQLPNTTAHNETCANIGNMLWNWRMLLASGQARYADALEQALYNSVLSGASLDGTRFFYTNPLRASRNFPYDLRWSGGREPYITLSNCCPPNLGRTLAEVADYMYSLSGKGLYLNLYGGNKLSTHLPDGSAFQLTEQTAYPWDGHIALAIERAPAKNFSIFLRIPGWCKTASLKVNGQPVRTTITPGQYAEVHRTWNKGDAITLDLPMPATLLEANPLVEETRGQVAVRRGPVVYCLESPDFPGNIDILRIALPATAIFKTMPMHIGGHSLTALSTTAKLLPLSDTTRLYQEVSKKMAAEIPVTLIPYYAWANRGPSDMTVWIDVIR